LRQRDGEKEWWRNNPSLLLSFSPASVANAASKHKGIGMFTALEEVQMDQSEVG
jgi:hypothetical protein